VANEINIVSFDVPWPPDYGGVTDVYWKLFWLHRAGIRIHLHCFTSRRPPAPELEKVCVDVKYYPRRTGILANLSLLPYTVRSRRSDELLQNLLANDFPVLFEVLHTCHLLNHPALKDRVRIYRHSNIEHEYYSRLAETERSLVKKIYLKVEAWKLRRFESIVKHADVICAVNAIDAGYFRKKFPQVDTRYIPSFHPNEDVNSETGRGTYALFHGNLSVSENYEAAAWLAGNVFPSLTCQVVVAGLNPPAFLVTLLGALRNVRLVASPSLGEMERLIAEAQVHVLYTHQATGLKLKLLNVLFGGRFVICNPAMLSGTGILAGATVVTATSPIEFTTAVDQCMNRDFTPELLGERKLITSTFRNQLNAELMQRVLVENNNIET
jgi:hypothetical protein